MAGCVGALNGQILENEAGGRLGAAMGWGWLWVAGILEVRDVECGTRVGLVWR